jgi:hypothetical protein
MEIRQQLHAEVIVLVVVDDALNKVGVQGDGRPAADRDGRFVAERVATQGAATEFRWPGMYEGLQS